MSILFFDDEARRGMDSYRPLPTSLASLAQLAQTYSLTQVQVSTSIGPDGGAIDAPLLHGLATLACWHAGMMLAAALSGEEPPHWENISSGHSGRLPPTGRAINHLVIQVSDVEARLGSCLSFSTEEYLYLYLASPVPLQTWHFTSNLFYFTYQNCPKCKTPLRRCYLGTTGPMLAAHWTCSLIVCIPPFALTKTQPVLQSPRAKLLRSLAAWFGNWEWVEQGPIPSFSILPSRTGAPLSPPSIAGAES